MKRIEDDSQGYWWLFPELNWHWKVWYRPHDLLYRCPRDSRVNHKKKYWTEMALELIPVEPHTKILAMNHTPHLLLPFAFYCTGIRNWDLEISYQNHMHWSLAIKSSCGRKSKALDKSVNKASKAPPYLHFCAMFLSL